nr:MULTISPECIES: hypothetical protein [unclassified Frankia]
MTTVVPAPNAARASCARAPQRAAISAARSQARRALSRWPARAHAGGVMPAGVQQPGQLLYEEGVAAGPGVHRRHDVAVGGDDEHRGVRKFPGQIGQQQHRGLVGAVQVVDDDDEAAAFTGQPDHGAHRVEQTESGRRVGLAGGAIDQALDVGPPRSESLRVQTRHRRGSAVRVGDQSPQHLDPGPGRRRATVLPAAAGDRADPGGRGVREQFVQEPGLADPGLAAEQHEPAAARACSVQPVDEQAQLSVPADQWGRACGLERNRTAPLVHLSTVDRRGHRRPHIPPVGRRPGP